MNQPILLMPAWMWKHFEAQPEEIRNGALDRRPGEVFEWPHVGWYDLGLRRLKVVVHEPPPSGLYGDKELDAMFGPFEKLSPTCGDDT